MTKTISLILTILTLTTFTPPPRQATDSSAQRAPAAAELPIVMYHNLTSKNHNKFKISPKALESDLKYLQKNGYTTVLMKDVIDFVKNGVPLPEKPVMLTFDDGNYSDYSCLLPLLDEYQMKAVCSIIGKTTDDYTVQAQNEPKIPCPHITWPCAKEMQDSGLIEIQSHSYNLHKRPLGSDKRPDESDQDYRKRLLEDLLKMQERTTEMLGVTPTTFAFPLGRIGKLSHQVLKDAGFAASLSCQEGMNTLVYGDTDCLWRLKRSVRPHDKTIQTILQAMK